MSDTDNVSHGMHMESHSDPMPSQSFGPFDEEQNLQVVLANFFKRRGEGGGRRDL